MTIRYPNGKTYHNNDGKKLKKQVKEREINYGSRGMSLEEAINQSNDYYREKEIAVIYKKPTPVQIVKVDYPRRSAAVIKEAYFRHASTTDYNGVFQGYYLDFEAKETQNKTSFPLKNFHLHQIEHMRACLKQNGICFVILQFNKLDRIFLLPAANLIAIWDKQFENGKKSISLKEIEAQASEVRAGIAPRIPYLTVIKNWLNQANEH